MKLLAGMFFVFALSAFAQCGNVECNGEPRDEDMQGQGNPTINCPNPQDYAPGCRSDGVAVIKKEEE